MLGLRPYPCKYPVLMSTVLLPFGCWESLWVFSVLAKQVQDVVSQHSKQNVWSPLLVGMGVLWLLHVSPSHCHLSLILTASTCGQSPSLRMTGRLLPTWLLLAPFPREPLGYCLWILSSPSIIPKLWVPWTQCITVLSYSGIVSVSLTLYFRNFCGVCPTEEIFSCFSVQTRKSKHLSIHHPSV